MSDGLAPMTPQNLEALKALHPSPSVAGPPMSTGRFHQPPFVPREDGPKRMPSLRKVISQLPNDSAPGLTGWSFAMLKVVYTSSTEFAAMFDALAIGIANDADGVPLRSWLIASRLLPLFKKNCDGLRSIAIGEAFGRAVARWVLTSVNPEAYLLPEQFGVGLWSRLFSV